MNRNRKYFILFIIYIGVALLFTSCRQIVLKVDKLPSNTPQGALVYVTGNFNLWDPGDNNYQMVMQADSTYSINLPHTIGQIEYKFTRGNWSTVEQNRCGYPIGNHIARRSGPDTIINQVESWADLDPVDCDSVTIVLDKVPEFTKNRSKIKIAGNFNAWNPGQKSEYEVKTDTITQKQYVTISRKANKINKEKEIQYIFIRDTIAIPEVDRFGREIGARTLQLERGDTINVSIENWKDQVDQVKNQVTIILTHIPENTPANDNIYLVGNFNDWDPGDIQYRFTKQKDGTYKTTIPRLKYGLSFKITRGDWQNEFSDKCGNKFGNQDYNYDEIDTLRIAIEGWIDKINRPNPNVVFIVDKYPQNTPEDAVLYLATSANGWNPGDKRYAFEKRGDGLYYLEKPRRLSLWDYKITRGNWLLQEVDAKGLLIENHWFNKDCVDTLRIKVENWNDLPIPGESITTIVLRKIPSLKLEDYPVYLVGQFNNWLPGDNQFLMQRNPENQPTITVPSRWLQYGFKFTRGDWTKVELDRNGDDIENRVYKGTDKVLYLEVEAWKR
jgi:hypothetical protein